MTRRRLSRAIATILCAGRAALAAEPGASTDATAASPPDAAVTLKLAVGAETTKDDEQRRALDHGVADPEGAPPEPERAPDTGERSGYAGGLRGTLGRAYLGGAPDAWFGRLEIEGFAGERFEGAGRTIGVLVGGEYWRGDAGVGGGLPATFWFGYRTPVLFTSLGLGAEMFIIDEVLGDSGFGLYAPFATATLGIELYGFRLLADARAIYRWQWGADDRAQYQVGLSMTQYLENPARPIQQPRGRQASQARSW